MSNAAPTIKFGTDGWRALMAVDFTSENVRACAEGVCLLLEDEGKAAQGLAIGYDSRAGSPEFAAEVAQVSAAHGITTYLSNAIVPTPVLSFNVLRHGAGGGVVITASHNSREWNGFKYKPDYAGSASPAIIERLEKYIAGATERNIAVMPLEQAIAQKLVVMDSMAEPYLANLPNVVDLDAIRSAGLRVGFDAMHGAGGGYFGAALAGGSDTVIEMRGERNTAFPGMGQPEPIAPNLGPSIAAARRGDFDVVIANDGDADRLGLLDEHGNFISTLTTFSLLCYGQLEIRGLRGPVVRSITQSSMIDKLCYAYGVPLHTTEVGFKYLGPVMTATDAIAAGEESGGYAFRGNIPERDGILSGLLFLELMAKTGKRPSELVDLLYEKVGAHHYQRVDVPLRANVKPRSAIDIAQAPPASLGGLSVIEVDTRDGVRFVLKGGFWGLIRFSGTEPLLRIYAEGDSPQRVKDLLSDLQFTAGVV
jgi:phosphomannomutase